MHSLDYIAYQTVAEILGQVPTANRPILGTKLPIRAVFVLKTLSSTLGHSTVRTYIELCVSYRLALNFEWKLLIVFPDPAC